MAVRGAPAIGCAAAFGVALEARRERQRSPVQFAGAMDAAFRTLAESRPTAVNLFWALERMRAVLAQHGDPATAADKLTEAAMALFQADVEINRAMGRAGAALVPDGARILTHCNTGALATAGHGTALGVVRSARDAGKRVSVIASETRPYLQGARLTAWELTQEAIPVTLITDSAAGHFLSRGAVDLVIVGADRIAANGDVANKIGTYLKALAARDSGIPFYVAAPSSTFDARSATGAAIPIEERDDREVRQVTGQAEDGSEAEVTITPPDAAVRNWGFDVTPARLVSGFITERGVIPAEPSAISKLLRP